MGFVQRLLASLWYRRSVAIRTGRLDITHGYALSGNAVVPYVDFVLCVLKSPASVDSVWHRYAAERSRGCIAARTGRLPYRPLVLFIYTRSFLAALLFDQWAGYWTTALSLFLGIWMKFGEGSYPIASKEELIPVALFALTCFGIISITQALRDALIRLRYAEAEKSLLYDELAHRMQNNLQVVTSLLTLQVRSYANPELRSALQNAIARIEVIAGAHRRLQQRQGASVDMQEYLGEICDGLRRLFDDILPIKLRVDVEPLVMPTDIAVPIGLLVNELVTNALKHAFPQERGGMVTVSLVRTERGAIASPA
jgi:two-component sensor histidine kinase